LDKTRIMHILCLGLNHQTANVGVREKLAFSETDIKASLSLLANGDSFRDSLKEMVILSTCNRVEIYAATPDSSFKSVGQFLARARGLPFEDVEPHLYCYSDAEAVNHLFRVASGLDSLVLGEAQILGQVSDAFELARGKAATGPILSRLFQAAIYSGRRARSETRISHNPASVSSIAVRLAMLTAPNIKAAHITVLGAGEMAELAVEALRKRGAYHITVVNRTLDKAQQLAHRWEGRAVTFEALPFLIEQTDILLCSTGAPHALVKAEIVRQAMRNRIERPLAIIDIAVPRDVEPEVGKIPGVKLYNMDTLQTHLALSLEGREKEIPKVEAILEEEKTRFYQYLETLDVIPIIAEIHQQAEAVRLAELEKTFRRLPGLSENEKQRIEAMTNTLVKKILSTPVVRLKSQSSTPQAAELATLARELFGLGDAE
jgi:glutamyl-tRNA reductase